MRQRMGAILIVTFLIVALPTSAGLAQDDDVEADSSEVIDLGESTIDPDPFGFCAGGECFVSTPGLTRDDILALDPAAVFTDQADPPGLVACVPGDGCQVLHQDITADDFESLKPGKGAFVGVVDGDLSGTWRVTDKPAKMVCARGGKGAPIKVKKGKHTDAVERLDNGRLLLSGNGLSEVISRLGPGVFAMTFKAKQGGLKAETRSFLGMQSHDNFRGFSESKLKRSGGTCSMTREFSGVRLSGPEIEIERGDETADGSSTDPGEPATADPDPADADADASTADEPDSEERQEDGSGEA